MKRAMIFAALLSTLFAACPAQAQDFPNKPIHLVVPYPAGGSSDLIARLVAEPMAKLLGQPVVIDNKPGAAGRLASAFVARAAPDGYTLLATNLGPAAVAPALYSNLGYRPIEDFTPVSLTGVMPLVLTVGEGSSIRSVGDLIRQARARPGKLNFATTGNGSLSHVVIELFDRAAGIQAAGIPYKGGADAATAAIAGDVDYFVGPPSDIIGLIRAGRLRPIAITMARRSPLLPDVPTIAESGLPGFEVDYWNGIMAPARTPAAVVDALNKAIATALADAEVKTKMAGAQVVPAPGTPAAFGEIVRKDVAKWTQLVQSAGIKGD